MTFWIWSFGGGVWLSTIWCRVKNMTRSRRAIETANKKERDRKRNSQSMSLLIFLLEIIITMSCGYYRFSLYLEDTTQQYALPFSIPLCLSTLFWWGVMRALGWQWKTHPHQQYSNSPLSVVTERDLPGQISRLCLSFRSKCRSNVWKTCVRVRR